MFLTVSRNSCFLEKFTQLLEEGSKTSLGFFTLPLRSHTLDTRSADNITNVHSWAKQCKPILYFTILYNYTCCCEWPCHTRNLSRPENLYLPAQKNLSLPAQKIYPCPANKTYPCPAKENDPCPPKKLVVARPKNLSLPDKKLTYIV